MRISIIIPTYERQSLLFDLVKKLNKQNFSNYEVFILDQSLKDLTLKFKDYKNLNFELNYIHLNKPSVCYARNLGVKKSKSKIILFLDDDMFPNDYNYLTKIENYMSQNKNIDAIQGQIIENNRKKMRFNNKDDFSNTFNKETEEIDILVTGNCIIRKKAFISVYGFNEQYKGQTFGFEDGDLGKRLIKKGYRIRFVPKIVVNHLHFKTGGNRDNDSNFVLNFHNSPKRFITYFQYYDEHYSGLNKLINFLKIYQKILKNDVLRIWRIPLYVIPGIIFAFLIARKRRKEGFKSIFK